MSCQKYLVIYADILPAGWISRSAFYFSYLWLFTLTFYQKYFLFIPLDKGHAPENLWKLSVTYLFIVYFWFNEESFT